MAVLVEGELAAVEAAIAAGEQGVRRVGRFRGATVLPAPDDAARFLTALAVGTCSSSGPDPDHVC